MSRASHHIDLKRVLPAQGLARDLLPLHGRWTEPQYLLRTGQTNHLDELARLDEV